MLQGLLYVAALLCWTAQAQNGSFPLESVILEGTGLSHDAVLEISGLRIGAAVDKTAIESGCAKLKDSGLFESISYRYAPGPKRGYVITLMLEDQKRLSDAVIDFPGVDEDKLWRWLASLYPPFNRKVPGNDAAQELFSRKLADHAKVELDGQRVVARMESDLMRRKTIVSFQPETLPRIAAMNFTGQRELKSEELVGLLQKITTDQGYTDRHFRDLVEMNLRRAYEEHGMYRVKFPKIDAQKTGAGAVVVTTAIEEGSKYTLGDVEFAGNNLPVEAMLKAAHFNRGQTANWTDIQRAIWEAEKPVKRTGYLDAAARPERIFRDDQHVLDLKIAFFLGPLYRFGQLQMKGLTPTLEAQARKLWKLQPKDTYDYACPGEFLRAFLQSVDARQFKKYDVRTQKLADNVMDVTLVFEPK